MAKGILKIHVVENEEKPGTVRLIEAYTAAGAVNAAYPKITARVASQADLVKYLADVKVELHVD